MISTDSPNARFDHAYAILRLDTSAVTGATPDPELVAVTKIVFSEEFAKQEVERLNSLNAEKGSVYVAQITRLERR